jgi:hypothetical protein
VAESTYFCRNLYNLIQGAQLAGTPVKFNPVYHEVTSFNVDFKAAVLAKKLFPAYNPKLRAAKRTLHIIPPSNWMYTHIYAITYSVTRLLLYYKCKNYATFLFCKGKGIIITRRIISCLFILFLNSGKIALYNHEGDIHMQIGMYRLSFHN